MIDDEKNPRLAGFCLSVFLEYKNYDRERAGVIGYIAPELLRSEEYKTHAIQNTHGLSKATDVFTFSMTTLHVSESLCLRRLVFRLLHEKPLIIDCYSSYPHHQGEVYYMIAHPLPFGTDSDGQQATL